jgi:hypothetical protein
MGRVLGFALECVFFEPNALKGGLQHPNHPDIEREADQ